MFSDPNFFPKNSETKMNYSNNSPCRNLSEFCKCEFHVNYNLQLESKNYIKQLEARVKYLEEQSKLEYNPTWGRGTFVSREPKNVEKDANYEEIKLPAPTGELIRASQKCNYCNQYVLGGERTYGNSHFDCYNNYISQVFDNPDIPTNQIRPTTPINQPITTNQTCPGAPKINARRGVKESIDTTTYPISYQTVVCPNTKSNLCCYEPTCQVCSH